MTDSKLVQAGEAYFTDLRLVRSSGGVNVSVIFRGSEVHFRRSPR